jgi:hypothetical protein
LYVGAVDGIFDSRILQHVTACIFASEGCTPVVTLSEGVGALGTTCVHALIFLVGGTIAYIIWIGIEFGLIQTWDRFFTGSKLSRMALGGLLTGACVGAVSLALIGLLEETIPGLTIQHQWLPVLAAPLALVSGGLGFFVPVRSIQDSVRMPFPFSRFDAIMMAAFAMCILLPYITLTNSSNLAAALLHFPHALSPTTTPPIQLQRIAYFSRASILLGIPIAFAVGGLTRAVYRWAMSFPHRRLGAVGIGLTLFAFLCQLIQPTVALLGR